MTAVRSLLIAIAIGLVATAPAPAQRVGTPQPFPATTSTIAHFHEDPRLERLGGYLQELAKAPKDWSDYPVLVGFFAETFRRHPEWIERLLPAQFDAKTADTVTAALRLSGQSTMAQALSTRLAQAGHDPRLNAELADLPAKLEELQLATLTHLDIMWGAYFATGDVGHVREILDFFARRANSSDAVAIDITKVTVAMGSGAQDDLKQVAARHDKAALMTIVFASTAEWALIANAQNFPIIKQTLARYVAEHPDLPAAKSLSAFLKQL